MKTNQKSRVRFPVSVIIPQKDLRHYANEPLKEEVKFLKKQLISREKYIMKIHNEIRNVKKMIMFSCVSDEVVKPMKSFLTKKRLLILTELYDVECLSKQKIYSLMTKLKMNMKSSVDLKHLIENELVKQLNENNFYITDKGKQFVEYYEKNTKILFSQMLSKRGEIRFKNPKNYTITDEGRRQRSERYHKMMRPFWDSSLMKIPRDLEFRRATLLNWMKLNEMTEDEFYVNLLNKWSAKK